FFYNGVGGLIGGYTSIVTDFATLNGAGGWNQIGALDYNTGFANPQFLNPTGTALTLDLRLAASNPAEGMGDTAVSNLVGIDFDGTSRASNTPADIGADAGLFTRSLDAFPPVINFNPLSNSGSTTTRILSGVNVVDAGGVPTT